MAKLVFFYILVTCFIFDAQSLLSEQEIELMFENSPTVNNYFQENCPDLKNRLKLFIKSIKSTDSCYNHKMTFCDFIRNNFTHCTKPLTKIIANCLPQHAKDLPSMFIAMSKSMYEYICSSKGRDLIELINPCIWDFKNFHLSENCEMKIYTISQKLQRIPSQREACSALKDIKLCMFEGMQNTCPFDYPKKAFQGFIDAIAKPCNA